MLRSGLLVALVQQATLAVQLMRLAYSAKETAVLMERTRIGQEIHDGLLTLDLETPSHAGQGPMVLTLQLETIARANLVLEW